MSDIRQEKKRVRRLKCKLVALNSKFIHSSPALFYLRRELLLHCPGIGLTILQATINDNYYETLLAITEDEPDIVFLSANIWNSDRIETLVCDINSCLPGCVVVVGGPQAAVVRKNLDERMCTVVIGEIEAVPVQFFEDLQKKRMEPIYTGSFLRQNIGRLDFPYSDEDFSTHLQNRHIYYESSRGCMYSCSYCLSAAEKGLFHKDVDQVKEELRTILKHNPKVVRFVDRTFNDLPERAMEIWQFLLEEGGETLFHFEIAPERFSEEMFELLEKVACDRFQFEIGVQSTHRPTVRAINRSVDGGSIHNIIERLAELQTIHLHVDLILGLPYETRESFEQSFRDLFGMGAHYIQMGLLKILPGTPIADQAEEYGYSWSTCPPYSVFANRWLDHATMSRMYRFCECVEKFHNNRYFISLWNYLRKSGEDIACFFQDLLELGLSRGLFERAPTQEFLTGILVELCKTRTDFQGIREMLRYDWLRCGFRKLPECLEFAGNEEGLIVTRDHLYRTLPEKLEGVFDSRQRNGFFKKSVFLKLSVEGCSCLGIQGDGGVRLVVLGERERGLFRHNRVITFDKDNKLCT